MFNVKHRFVLRCKEKANLCWIEAQVGIFLRCINAKLFLKSVILRPYFKVSKSFPSKVFSAIFQIQRFCCWILVSKNMFLKANYQNLLR